MKNSTRPATIKNSRNNGAIQKASICVGGRCVCHTISVDHWPTTTITTIGALFSNGTVFDTGVTISIGSLSIVYYWSQSTLELFSFGLDKVLMLTSN